MRVWEGTVATLTRALIRASATGKRPLVMISRGGGIGDNVQACFVARSIKERWPDSYVMLLVRNALELPAMMNIGWASTHSNLMIDNTVNLAGGHDHNALSETYRSIPDVFIDMRYAPGVFIRGVDVEGLAEWKQKYDADWNEWYQTLFDEYPMSNSDWIKMRTNLLHWQFDRMKLPYVDELPMACEDITGFMDFCDLTPGRYVTLAAGAGGNAERKEWPLKRDELPNGSDASWYDVAAYLRTRGYKVVQLGMADEKAITSELVMPMLGRVTINRSVALIKNAAFHVGIEGGLVHIAKAMGKLSVVVMGPTGKEQFGYASNINVGHERCFKCFWATERWYEEPCPLDHEHCLNFPDSDEVRAACDEAIRRIGDD